jgi:fibronectin-binding autotransporter adhesin
MNLRSALSALALSFLATSALAQSNPGFVTGQIPTAAQWNSYFAAKLDYNPAAPYLTSCAATSSGLVPVPPNDPTRFLNGQCAWTTASGSGNVSSTGSSASVNTIPTWTGTYTLNPAGLSYGTTGVSTLLMTGPSGVIDNSVLNSIPSAVMLSTVAAGSCTNCNLNYDGAGRITLAANGNGGGSGSFNALTSGTNTTATMLVGTGALLSATGSGSINATSMPATGLTGTLLAAQFPTLVGDITTPGASLTTTLATVNGNVGSFTNANITVDAKGRVTAASNGVGGSTSFGVISSGTNSTAAMFVGSGASLASSGGPITATAVPFSGVSGLPNTLGGYGITNGATNGANSNITSLSGLTTALSVPQGGTGITSLTAGTVPMGAGTSALAASEISDFASAGVVIGSPAGGQKGAGSINMSACFINNVPCAAGSSTAWATITGGTLTGQALVLGSGSSLGVAGGGTIAATSMPASGLTGTLLAAQFPALTGDVTSTAGSLATTLATVNSNVGTFTNTTVTVDAKGRVTAISSGVAGSTPFNGLTSGTNTTATMLVGSGATLGATGTGTITATTMNTTGLTGTLQAAQFPALTGDITTTGGALATTLATVNANVGTFAVETVNAKGLVTSAGNLTGDVTTSAGVATLATVNSNIGTFSNATVTVDPKGRITAVSNGGSGVTSFTSISNGTNTTAAMLVGTGASLGVAGTGTITATNVPASLGTGSVCSIAGVLSVPAACALVPTSIATSTVALVAANAGQIVVATSGSPTTLTLAQSTGSLGTGFGIDAFTAPSTSTLNVTTSTLNGLSSIKMGAYQNISIAAIAGGNYVGALSVPQPATQTHTNCLWDDFVWAPCSAAGITSLTLAPGFTTTIGTQNTSGQTITTTGTINGQLWPVPQTGAYNVQPADTGNLLLANGTGSFPFTLPNPASGTKGSQYQFNDIAGHGYSLATVSGTANFLGCSGSGGVTLAIAANTGVSVVDTGTSYSCLLYGGGGGGGGSGTVNTGVGTHLTYYQSATNAVFSNTHLTETGSLHGIDYNTAALPTALTGTVMQAANADATPTRFEADAFGSQAFFTGAVYGGTNASPTAVTAGTQGGGYNTWFYNGTSMVGPLASFRTFANENQAAAGTHGGTYVDITATPLGSQTPVSQMQIVPSAGGSGGGGGAGVNFALGTSHTPVTLTQVGSTIAVDASKGSVFAFTISGTPTLSFPTNLPTTNQQTMVFEVTQPVGGGVALAFASGYTGTISLNMGANQETTFTCISTSSTTAQCQGGAVPYPPETVSWLSQNLAAATAGTGVFIAAQARTITSISCRVETAVGSGTAVIDVWVAPSGTALASGTKATSTSCNANGAAATNQAGLISAPVAVAAGSTVGIIATGGDWASAAAAASGTLSINVQ